MTTNLAGPSGTHTHTRTCADARHSRAGTRTIAARVAVAVLTVVATVAVVQLRARPADATPAASYRPGTFALQELSFTAYDPTRWTPARTAAPAHPGRWIKTLVYVPVGAQWPMPTVIFGPGAYVRPDFDGVNLRTMASAGYLVIGLDFPGSTAPDETGSILSRDLQNNAEDFSFMYSWLQQNQPWSQMVDFSKVAAAGHSDGAIEVAALALNSQFLDHRFAAFLELSGGTDASFGCCYGPYNTAPLFSSVGTADEFGAYGTTINTWGLANTPKTLVQMQGADHWRVYTLFYGPQSDAIRGTIVEWLNTTLRHDPDALPWLWSVGTSNGLSLNTASGNAVDSTYGLLGGWRSPLGYQTSDVGGDARNFGIVGYYQNGAIFDTPGLGTKVVWGAIWSKYAATGSINGPLGYATSNEEITTDGVGRFNRFQTGSIYWTPYTGAYYVMGAIQADWFALGAERGGLGYPVSDETPTPDGIGRFNQFQYGSVYWTPSTGAHGVVGAVRNLWAAMGWEHSWLGYPTGDPVLTTTSLSNMFQGGSIWSSSYGSYALTRPITDRYILAGGSDGPLGPPTGSTTTSGAVHTSTFLHGSIVADTGAGTVTVNISAQPSSTGPINSLGVWANNAYLALLGRPADPGGAAYVVDQARRGGNLAGITLGLTLSNESLARTTSQLFQQVLGRPVDAAGSNWGIWFLATGGRPIDLTVNLATSAEFIQQSGGSISGYVSLLYSRLLGRPVDPAGLSYWSGQIGAGVPLTTVAATLASSQEAAANAVTRAYQTVLGRTPDAGGLANWSSWWIANGGNTARLSAVLAASVEFTNR